MHTIINRTVTNLLLSSLVFPWTRVVSAPWRRGLRGRAQKGLPSRRGSGSPSEGTLPGPHRRPSPPWRSIWSSSAPRDEQRLEHTKGIYGGGLATLHLTFAWLKLVNIILLTHARLSEEQRLTGWWNGRFCWLALPEMPSGEQRFHLICWKST